MMSNLSNGTIGVSNHGYGPIGGGALAGLMANNTGMGGMNINVYKQNSSNNQNIKDSISFSKINAKMKKRQLNTNISGL